MDFFEHQDRARKKTGQLIFLFILGVLGTLVAVNLLTFLGYWLMFDPVMAPPVSAEPVIVLPEFMQGWFSAPENSPRAGFAQVWQHWWHSNLNWQISMGVLAAVAIGTAFRYFELAGGGRAVARWAGAKEVDMNSSDANVRRLINVSEEMAIAAGMAVPELFVMDRELSINAFVAGYDPDEAVLVVTRGALETLTRDQLQGVIGHEYSHILNGDMRLNVRLMAFLAGLVMIGQIGRFLLENSFRRGARSSKDEGKAGIAFFAFGLMLTAVGYIGVLVGRMIKAAVSRQREYLADASAVQFTRNPDGLAGALYAIKQRAEGSGLRHPHAEDMSHFCFGESVSLSEKLATHPPVEDRIRRISPNFIAKARSEQRRTESVDESVARSQPQAFETVMMAAGLTALVGNTSPERVDYARQLYQHIPQQLKDAVHTSVGARAYIYSLLLLGNDESHQQLLVDLIKQEDAGVLSELEKVWAFARKIDQQLRKPVLELALPTLKRLPESDRLIFIDRLQRLVHLDQRVDLLEWITITLTRQRLQNHERPKHTHLKGKIDSFKDAINTVLQVFVMLSPDMTRATPAYQRVCAQFDLTPVVKAGLPEVGFEQLDDALNQLDHISFTWRKVILQGCADIVQSDGRIAFAEYDALRMVAECLDCPMPPMMQELSPHDERDLPIPFN